MLPVNYLRVVGREHVAAKRAERNEGSLFHAAGEIRKTTEAARKAYEGLSK